MTDKPNNPRDPQKHTYELEGGLMGIGQIVKKPTKRNKSRLVYDGHLPSNVRDGDQAVVLSIKALELIVRTGQVMLINTRHPMEEEFFSHPHPDAHPVFPDGLVQTHTNEQINLYLDRHFYSLDPTRYLWLRYSTIDNMEEEERQLNIGGDRT